MCTISCAQGLSTLYMCCAKILDQACTACTHCDAKCFVDLEAAGELCWSQDQQLHDQDHLLRQKDLSNTTPQKDPSNTAARLHGNFPIADNVGELTSLGLLTLKTWLCFFWCVVKAEQGNIFEAEDH